eukprot:68827-Prymnesium_polylepis.1
MAQNVYSAPGPPARWGTAARGGNAVVGARGVRARGARVGWRGMVVGRCVPLQAVRRCGGAAVCGSVRQCAAVSGSVRQCAAVCAPSSQSPSEL